MTALLLPSANVEQQFSIPLWAIAATQQGKADTTERRGTQGSVILVQIQENGFKWNAMDQH